MGVHIETEIPTLDGWKRIGDLKIGDLVFGDDGRPAAIQGVSSVTSGRCCYEVTFSDSTKLIVDETQKFATLPYRIRHSSKSSVTTENLFELITAKNMKETLIYPPNRGKVSPDAAWLKYPTRNHAIKIGEPLSYCQQELPIHPYVLGAWLGDGHSHFARFTTSDMEIINCITQAGYPARKMKDKYKWSLSDGNKGKRWSKQGLRAQLGDLHLLGNKHIPEIYLQSSIPQRILLLQGLMDTDGNCTQNGYCAFTNTNLDVITGTYELLVGLGIKASVTKRKLDEAKNVISHKLCYVIGFTPTFAVFHLSRKLARQKLDHIPPSRYLRYVAEVKEVAALPTCSINLDHEKLVFLVGKDCIAVCNGLS